MDGNAVAVNVLDVNAPKYKKARKIIKTADHTIDRILTVLLLIILLIGVWFAYDSYYVFNGAKLGSMASYKPNGKDDAARMKQLSSDVVAWITIDDTEIDYPIVQGEDNNKYLNRNAYGEYSLAGAIFLDAGNAPDFSDNYNLVYGHHMSGGYMFGALDDFVKQDFYEAHRTGKLITAEGKEYKLAVFAFMLTDAGKREVFDIDFKTNRMSFIASNSMYFEWPKGSQIVALSTCKSPLTTDRTILFAEMIEEIEEENKETTE